MNSLSYFSNNFDFYFKNYLIYRSIVVINNNDFQYIQKYFNNNNYDFLYINDINNIYINVNLLDYKLFIITYDLFYNFINFIKYINIIQDIDLIFFYNSNLFTKKLFTKYYKFVIDNK